MLQEQESREKSWWNVGLVPVSRVPRRLQGSPGLRTGCVRVGMGKEGVLVSAGIEIIFFLVAGTVLCFRFSMKIMLITH